MPDLTLRDLTVRTREGRVILRAKRLDVATGEALGWSAPWKVVLPEVGF